MVNIDSLEKETRDVPGDSHAGLLEMVDLKEKPAERLDGVVIGRLAGLGDSGRPLVDFPSNSSDGPLAAMSTVCLDETMIHREIALMFTDGDPRKPIVIGLIQHPGEISADAAGLDARCPKPDHVEVDGERLVFSAEKEIVLRCGKASITLTRAGKVLIRGAYLLHRSSGVNRIKGGSVQIN